MAESRGSRAKGGFLRVGFDPASLDQLRQASLEIGAARIPEASLSLDGSPGNPAVVVDLQRIVGQGQ